MLVFIHHETRLVRIADVTTKPVTDWVTQQARNISMELAEQAVKFLIRDRGTSSRRLSTPSSPSGDQDPQNSVRAPRANPITERSYRTIRRECLDQMLILGRRHLEAVLAGYVGHYNSHRPHRSLGLQAPCKLALAQVQSAS